MMTNIAYVMQKGNMNYFEIMELPYVIFLSLLKQFQMFELMQNEDYRKQLQEQKLLERKDADLESLRTLIKHRKEE